MKIIVCLVRIVLNHLPPSLAVGTGEANPLLINRLLFDILTPLLITYFFPFIL